MSNEHQPLSENFSEDQNLQEEPQDAQSFTGTPDDNSEKNEDDALLKIQNELSQSKDQYLRLVAEFDNFRKRTAKERLELVQTANKDLMKELIPILDDAERAQKNLAHATDLEALKEGLNLVMGKMVQILQQKGLKGMDTKEGDDFDAELHEAITELPAPDPSQAGKVLAIVEQGYYLNDKIVRHAKVVVGK